jgi:hypothetical protein
MNGTINGHAKNRITVAELQAKKCSQPESISDDDDWPPTRTLGPTDALPIPAEDRRLLDELLPRLPRIENLIIRARLGLDDGQRLTQAQVAEIVCKSATQVSKYEVRAKGRLLAAGVDISDYLPRRWPRTDPDDVLPMAGGARTENEIPSSSVEADARRAVLRALLDLPPDVASRILGTAADALGITLR